MRTPRWNINAVSAPIGKCVIFTILLGYSILCFSVTDNKSKTPSINVLNGTVTILDQDGNEIEDRSNVVIFIDGISTNNQIQDHQKIPKMSHKGRQFTPHVLPIVKQGVVDFFNDDRIYHNVFSLSKAKTFDLGIYPQGTSKLVTFSQSGLVKIYCNMHPKMASNILVLNNPLFAKTNVDGSYTINNIPDGVFSVRLWYEFSDGFSQQISLQGGQQLTKNIAIKVTKKIRRHKNKFGKSYREKY